MSTTDTAGRRNGHRATVVAGLHRARDEQSITALAARDQQDDEAPTPDDATDATPTWPGLGLAPDLADELIEEGKLPWVSLVVGHNTPTEVASLPVGGIAFLMGAPGGGKSSMAVEMAIHHARAVGPVVFVSREMKRAHTVARVVSNLQSLVWRDVACGRVAPEVITAALATLPDLAVIDGKRANLRHAAEWVAAFRRRGDHRPALAICDYVQILDGQDEARDERARVSKIIEDLREWAGEQRVAVLALTQMSRAAARALLAGEIAGADTTSGGAETAQIERAAFVTIAIGGLTPHDDGSTAAQVSIGKARFGGGDVVFPCEFWGASGRWRIAGPAVPGAEVKVAKVTAKSARDVEDVALMIRSALADGPGPTTRTALAADLHKRPDTVGKAADRLLASPATGVVEVRPPGGRRGRGWPLWLRDKATAAGIEIVPRGAE